MTMGWLEAVILAIIQGLTEFLPISSSAHLILPSQLLGWEDQGLAFDVAVHVGTLLAVVTYFRKDVIALISGWLKSFRGEVDSDGRLAWLIILATFPAALSGLLLADAVETFARSALVIAMTTIIFGLLLWYADAKTSERKNIPGMGWRDALTIGLAQILALIPGTSRSGITMTAAMLIGYSKTDAARFSFLLSIPIIVLAGSYLGLKLATGTESVAWDLMGLGVLASFIAAFACIHLFLKVIERMGMLPFVIYRLLLGLVLLVFVLA